MAGGVGQTERVQELVHGAAVYQAEADVFSRAPCSHIQGGTCILLLW